jgi:hypothetical protein
MCTVSIIPFRESGVPGFRVVCNRDESHERADAAPPRWREVGSRRAIWPADGEAGGTWIGARDDGVVLSLLNRNPRVREPLPPADRLVSRGRIIPELLAIGDSEGLVAIEAALARLPLDRYAPFRLVGAAPWPGSAGGFRAFEASWDRRSLTCHAHDGDPVCFASSGLGDHLVQVRLPLFDGLVVAAGADARSQDLFHAHRWPDKPELSVMMCRAEARTVSVTHVEVAPEPGPRASVRMQYRPVVWEGAAVVPSSRSGAARC